MLRSVVVSKAAKIAALCVCPVGATAVITTQVPQVRSIVHKMTAPRHVAHRLAPRTVPNTAAPVQTAMAAPCPAALPVVFQGGDPLTFPTPTLTELSFAPPVPGAGPGLSFAPVTGIVDFPAHGGGGDFAALPETNTWVQFGLGFALLGGALRAAGSRAKANPAKAAQFS